MKNKNFDENYGSAPIIFLDESKRKEWENLPDIIRKNVFSMLHKCCEQMTQKMTIEMLCNVIIDLEKRVKDLENKSYDV